METFEATVSPQPYFARAPLAWIFLCFASGVLAHGYLRFSFTFVAALSAALLLLGFLVLYTRLSMCILLSAVILLGFIYSGNYQTFSPQHINHIHYYDRKDLLTIEGLVVSDVEPRPFFKGKKTVFVLKVKRIESKSGWRKKSGEILVNLFRSQDIRYGDYVQIEGRLHRPFNFSNDSQFSYREFLYRKGISYILSVKKQGCVEVLMQGQGNWIVERLFHLKHQLKNILYQYLPKKEAGIMLAFLLGDRYDIPKNVYELFKVSGVAHIIAISGFNIGIVACLIFLILKIFPIPRQAQYVLTSIFLIFYAFLTGGQPPVVRATIMAVVFLASFLFEREHESINTLSAAALILLLMNPLNLFDVGFQLSFISVLFILVLYPKLMNIFYKWLPAFKEGSLQEKDSRKHGPLSALRIVMIRYLLQSTAVSLCAYFGVVVLVAYYFQIITPVVLLANMVVVPLASLTIFLGMGLLLVGFMLPFLAFTFASCITVLLNFMVACVFVFAQMPGAYFYLRHFSLKIVIFYYALIFLAFLMLRLINSWKIKAKLKQYIPFPLIDKANRV